jgi:hypothetical protein
MRPLLLLTLLISPASAQLKEEIAQYQETEEQRACKRDVTALVATLYNNAWTCTARCSRDNLWLGFVGATAGTAQGAYDKAVDACSRGGMALVDKTLSCLNNYWAASYHEELEKDCPKRKATLEAELSYPRMTCTATLGDQSMAPLYATVTTANSALAYAAFADKVSRSSSLAFKSFAPATDCVWAKP